MVASLTCRVGMAAAAPAVWLTLTQLAPGILSRRIESLGTVGLDASFGIPLVVEVATVAEV